MWTYSFNFTAVYNVRQNTPAKICTTKRVDPRKKMYAVVCIWRHKYLLRCIVCSSFFGSNRDLSSYNALVSPVCQQASATSKHPGVCQTPGFGWVFVLGYVIILFYLEEKKGGRKFMYEVFTIVTWGVSIVYFYCASTVNLLVCCCEWVESSVNITGYIWWMHFFRVTNKENHLWSSLVSIQKAQDFHSN